MARKRGSKSSASKPGPRSFNKKESSLKRWDKRSDIPENEIDKFHSARDKILLDGDDGGSEDSDEDEEVFALKGMPEDSDEESDEGEGEGEDNDEGEDEDMDESAPGPSQKPATKRKGKKDKSSPAFSDASESESEDEGWGRKKSEYYSSNAAQLESDDEEANELEEQEAKRLQAKAREALTDDDFGLADAVENVAEPEDELEEPPASVVQELPQDTPSILRHLEKTSPETLALARDWDDVAHSLTETQAKISALEAANPDALSLGMVHLHYQALLTYATTLAFYLHLRSTEKYAAQPELLRAHPIMARLLTLKQSIGTLEDLGFSISDSEDEDDESGVDEDEDAYNLWKMDQLDDMDPEELRELMEEADKIVNEKNQTNGAVDEAMALLVNGSKQPEDGEGKKKKKKTKKTETTTALEEPPKKKRKTSTTSTPLPVFDLVEPTFPKSKSSSSTKHTATADSAADPYGELTALQSADAQDKAARKKSLRFHTSKIESASSRREKARAGHGGDDDIPWKDRRKEKRAEKAKRGMGGDDLDDVPPEPRQAGGGERTGKRRRDEVEGSGSEGEGPEGYYELVKRKSKESKEKKKSEYEALTAAQRAIEQDSVEGPRGLTQAILKNKGLTPHRSKSVRNPRVKKRQKFEKAKKKVASQKAVYKGGVSETGRYDGEKSGISKVIKSVRL